MKSRHNFIFRDMFFKIETDYNQVCKGNCRWFLITLGPSIFVDRCVLYLVRILIEIYTLSLLVLGGGGLLFYLLLSAGPLHGRAPRQSHRRLLAQ